MTYVPKDKRLTQSHQTGIYLSEIRDTDSCQIFIFFGVGICLDPAVPTAKAVVSLEVV